VLLAASYRRPKRTIAIILVTARVKIVAFKSGEELAEELKKALA
jgi:hypothetical protein